MTYDHQDNQDQNLTLFNKACNCHESGNHLEAEKLYRRLLDEIRDNWLLHYNFGLLLLETGRMEEALSHYLSAASLTTKSADLYYNLALCHKQCGHYKMAVNAYRQAIELDPEDLDSHYNLAGCHLDLEEFEQAISCYQRVLEKTPQHQSALNNLAYVLQKVGKTDKAIHYYKRLLEVNPEHSSADHMYAALTGSFRSSAPPSYIRELFDNYSSSYEDSLVNRLQYTLPDTLLHIITASSGKQSFGRLLDLGCGTGLIGEKFRDSAALLHGVDISPKMIEIARSKELYDVLVTGDVHTVLNDLAHGSYDLLVAADVFTYIGDISEILIKAYLLGTRECQLYFSVEDLAHQTEDTVLQESGRFAHSENYIRRTAEDSGWQTIDVQRINLRTEKDQWISGAVYAMKKTLRKKTRSLHNPADK